MIFASFGNSPVSFPRMAAALERLAQEINEEVIVQSGYTQYDFKFCHSVGFMDSNLFYYHLKSSTVSILQGGWGSISTASELGVRIVAFPRFKGIEHHHDQFQLVKALEEMGVCLGCYDEKDLTAIVEKAKSYRFLPIKRGSATDIINSFISSI